MKLTAVQKNDIVRRVRACRYKTQAEALHAAVQLAEEAVDASLLTPSQRHADELLAALKAMNAGCRDPYKLGLLLSFDMARAVLSKIEADGQEGGAA